jgi:raffinose/stachyose/melibiose transport system substrate-binding protein
VGQVTFADLSSQIAAAQEGDTFTMTAFPTSDDEPFLAVADSYGFAVNKEAKEPELAEKFIEFTASPAGQNAFADATGGVPSLPNDEFEASSPQQEQVAAYIAEGRTAIWPDQLWPSPEVQATLFVVVQNLFNGIDTPETAAQKMDDAFVAALEG